MSIKKTVKGWFIRSKEEQARIDSRKKEEKEYREERQLKRKNRMRELQEDLEDKEVEQKYKKQIEGIRTGKKKRISLLDNLGSQLGKEMGGMIQAASQNTRGGNSPRGDSGFDPIGFSGSSKQGKKRKRQNGSNVDIIDFL